MVSMVKLNCEKLLHNTGSLGTDFAQFIAVCSSSILEQTLGYAVSFSSLWRGKQGVLDRRKVVLIDQLQLSTNSDKLNERAYQILRREQRRDAARTML